MFAFIACSDMTQQYHGYMLLAQYTWRMDDHRTVSTMLKNVCLAPDKNSIDPLQLRHFLLCFHSNICQPNSLVYQRNHESMHFVL